MSPRTKRITNAQLLMTAARVVNERGAEHTRLSDIAAVSGLAPATLLQRFGSLEGLLDAISAVFVEQVRDAFDVYGASPLAGLETSLARIGRERHLVFLVTRPAGAAAWSLEVRKHIAFSLAGAVEAGSDYYRTRDTSELLTRAREDPAERYGASLEMMADARD